MKTLYFCLLGSGEVFYFVNRVLQQQKFESPLEALKHLLEKQQSVANEITFKFISLEGFYSPSGQKINRAIKELKESVPELVLRFPSPSEINNFMLFKAFMIEINKFVEEQEALKSLLELSLVGAVKQVVLEDPLEPKRRRAKKNASS